MKPGTIKAAKNDPLKELKQSWRTPAETFEKLHSLFRFTVDACADADNALLPKYWSREDDCRLSSWCGERVFCNPPFSETASILPKCREAELAVVLLPVTSITTIYFCEHAPDWLLVPARRLKFIPPAGLNVANTRTPSLGTVIAVYGEADERAVRSLGHRAYRLAQ